MAVQVANYQATLDFDASNFTSGMSGASSKWSVFTSGLGNFSSLIVPGLITAAAAAGTAIVSFLKDSVSTGAEFDAAMSQVAATMGTTTDQIQDLRDYALEMGSTTSFSATEAAEGLNILAMAGLDADEQMASLSDVLNLAAAGTLSLDDAASYTVGTIKGFGDSVDNASYYTDLMAKGATLSNTSVSELGESLSGCAATASSYGQTADSVTVSLLRLAEQNVTGSAATTALNRAMADLYTPTDSAASALSELGISAYDASGQARDFNDVVDDLDGALAGMSDEQKNAYLNTIFTTQGLSAFNKMTASSSETVDGFKEALTDATGSAADQAATQLDNLQGDMTIFQSAMDGLKIAVSDKLTPALRGIVEFGTNVVSVFTDIISGNFNLQDAFSNLASNVTQKVNSVDWQGIGETVKTLIINGISKLVTEIPAKISEFATTFTTAFNNIDWHNVGYQAMQLLLNGIASIVTNIGGVVSDIASSIGETLKNTDWHQVGYDIMTAVLTGIKFIVVDIPSALAEFVTAAFEYIQGIDWLSLGQNIVEGIINGVTNFIPNLIAKVGEMCQGFLDAFKDFFGIASPSTVMAEQGQYLVDGVIQTLTSLPGEMLSILTTALQNVIQWGQNILTNATNAASNVLSNVTNFFSQLPGNIMNHLSTALSNIVSWGSNIVSNIKTSASNAISGAVSFFSQLPGKILSNLNTALSNIKSWGSSIVSNIKTSASNAISGAVSYFQQLPGKVLSQLNSVKSNVSSWGSSLVSSFKSIGKNVMSGLINGISSMVSSLYSSIKNALSGLVSKAKSALGIHSPSTVFRDEVGTYISQGIAVGVSEEMENTGDSITDDINNMVSDVSDSIDDIDSGVTLSADIDTSNVSGALGSVSTVLENNAIVSGLSNVFNTFIDNFRDILENASIGATGVKGTNGTTINMGNISVSGVLDKDAAEQVKQIADAQVDELADIISAAIPA